MTEHPFLARHMAKVDVDASGCWLWLGQIDSSNGYARSYAGNTDERWAHRNMWVMTRGSIPADLEIDHLCRVRRCVNPDHMELVTAAENMRRAGPYRRHGHGSEGCYMRGCRCEECRTAARAAVKRRHARRLADGDVEHGTKTAYGYGCRCTDCRRASSAAMLAYRRQQGVKPARKAEHGTTSMYTTHKCRCDACRQCWSEYWKAYRAAKREVAS